MRQENDAQEPNNADVFSRGSLKLTFNLIRKRNPSLALTIRNFTENEPYCNTTGPSDSPNSDHFKVKLNTFQVRAVVESLMAQVQSGIEGNPGMTIMARTLADDWMKLARKMFEDLPDDTKP